MQKIARIVTYLLVLVATAIFLAVAIPKIFFPYEVQWLEGSMLAEISWMRAGNILYCPPTIYHVPTVYQPLYFIINVFLTSITGFSFVTARFLSILATGSMLYLIYVVVRKETGQFFFGIAAIGLYLASYGKTEFCFVAARIDPLLTLLILIAVIMIFYARSNKMLILGSIVFALAFFTKQSALVFIPPAVLYLWIFRGWKNAAIFFGSVIAACIVGIVAMNIYSDGWYTFYTFIILRSMGGLVRWRYAIEGLFSYIILRCWLITTLVLFFPLYSFIVRKNREEEKASIYFGLFFATSILAGFLGILNSGGGHNVLLQAAAGCAIFLPILVSDLQLDKRFAQIAIWLIVCQLCFLISNPWSDNRNIARQIDRVNYLTFYKYAASLPGEIWIPFHSHLMEFTGKKDYACFDCLEGALIPDDTRARAFRYQLDTALADAHWTYILSDIQYKYPHYRLSHSILNLNKVHFSDDSLLYIYTPEK